MRFRRLNPYARPRPVAKCLRRRWNRDVRTRPPAKDEAREAKGEVALTPHRILSLRRLFLATGNWLLATALIALSGSALALDREAFTFSDYNLTAKIDPGFHVLRS